MRYMPNSLRVPRIQMLLAGYTNSSFIYTSAILVLYVIFLCVDRILLGSLSEGPVRIKIFTEFLDIIYMLQSRYGIAMDALYMVNPVLEKQLEDLIFIMVISPLKGGQT